MIAEVGTKGHMESHVILLGPYSVCLFLVVVKYTGRKIYHLNHF